MSLIYKIIILILPFMLAACQAPTNRALDHADAIMESHPDSALAIMQAIDKASLKSDRDKALYALLRTQAEVKCNVTVTDSAGIAHAVEYFSDHGPKHNLMRAFFYDGVTSYYLADHQKSTFDALSAYDLAEELNDTYWQAKASELIADNFSATYNHYGAIPYVKKAADLYEQSGRHLNYLFSMVDYAISLGNSHDRETAEEIVDSIYLIAKNEVRDSTLMAYCLQAQLNNARSLKKYPRVLEICEKLDEFDNYYPLTPLGYFSLACAHIAQGNLREAENAVKITHEKVSTQRDSVEVYEAELNLAEAKGDTVAAYRSMKRMLVFEFKELKKFIEHSITTTQRDYFTNKARAEAEKNEHIKICFLMSVVTLVIVILLISMRLRYKNAEIDRKVAEIWDLSRTVDAQRCKSDQNDRDMIGMNIFAESLFKERWDTIDALCSEFYDSRETKAAKARVLDRIEDELEKIKNDDEIMKIENSLNRLKDNIIAKLREQCPNLNESEIKFFTLNLAGFSYRTICLLLDITRTNFYQKRHRLMSRIQYSDASDKKLFIDSLR